MNEKVANGRSSKHITSEKIYKYLSQKNFKKKNRKRTLSNTQKNWYYLGNFSILDGNSAEKMRQFLYTWHLLLINPKINDPSSNI